ncbi:hypothetical protein AAHB59_00070 [Bacillus cereus]
MATMGQRKSGACSKESKKYVPVAARISIVIGSAIIFSNIIDIPHVFADGNNPDVNEVFKDVQSNDGKIKII